MHIEYEDAYIDTRYISMQYSFDSSVYLNNINNEISHWYLGWLNQKQKATQAERLVWYNATVAAGSDCHGSQSGYWLPDGIGAVSWSCAMCPNTS